MKKKKKIRVNLTLDSDFYSLLKTKADSEFVHVGTMVRQFLMKSFLAENNLMSNRSHQNESTMA